MAHAVETFEDGTAAFYSHRQLAWHKLGTVTEEAATLDEALKIAQLDWEVHKTHNPVYFSPNSEHLTVGYDPAVHGAYVTYRIHPKAGLQPLGIVGDQYTVVQNREIGELAEMIVDESGGIWETMGSLHGGKQLFMSIKLPSTIDFNGEDKHELYLVLGSSHNGTMAVTAIITDVRVVCQNTWNAAIRGATSKYVFRHTSGVAGRVNEARAALKLSFKYHEQFEKQMEEWLREPVTLRDFEAITHRVFPTHPKMTPLLLARAERNRGLATEIYMSPTQDFGRGSKYGVFNTFTEYDQWFKPVKGKDSDKDSIRASRTLFDTAKANSTAARAVKLLLAG